jgi:hypothetical protein
MQVPVARGCWGQYSDVDGARRRHEILGDGTPVTSRVVAVYGRGLGFGPVVLSRDLTAWHTTTALDQSILVRTDGTAAARQALTALVVSRPGLVLDSSDAGPGGVGGTPPEVWVNLAVLAVLLGYLLLEIANKTSKAIAPVGPSRLLFSCVVMEGRDSHCHRGAADWSDTESCDQPAQRDAHLGEFVGGLLGLGNAGGGDLGRGRYPGDVVSDLPAARACFKS